MFAGKEKKYDIAALLFVLLCAALISCMSPLAPFFRAQAPSDIDSSVFRYIGAAMAQGQLPYRDLFDHKGLLLYFINYLGYLISPRLGVYLLELVSLLLSAVCSYAALRRLFSPSVSAIAQIGSFLALANVFQGGNFTEEYALLFSSVCIYLILGYFKEQRFHLHFWEAFFIGVCAVCILMLRVNLVILPAIFCLYLLLHMLARRAWRAFGISVGGALLGALVALLPFCLYLFANGIFGDFFDCYIRYNLSYAGKASGESLFLYVSWFLHEMDGISWLAPLFSLLYLLRFVVRTYKEDGRSQAIRAFFAHPLVSTFLTALAACFVVVQPQRKYAHYAMLLIPLLSIFIAYMLDFLWRVAKEGTPPWFLIALSLVLVGYFSANNARALAANIQKAHTSDAEFERLVTTIADTTQEDDLILVLDIRDSIYVYSARMAASYYHYIPALGKEAAIARQDADILQQRPQLLLDPVSRIGVYSAEVQALYEYEETIAGFDLLRLKETKP